MRAFSASFSRPSRCQRGCEPPATDIGNFSSPLGKRLDVDFALPASFETTAIHFPSGENWPWLSLKGVWVMRTGCHR